MTYQPIEPTGAAYSQAYIVSSPKRFLFISGQVPEDERGYVPDTFLDQCRLTWQNIEARLSKAGMTLKNIVKINVFLASRQYREENFEVRTEVLGDHQPAMTIVIAGIYDDQWLLEIEVIAAD
ncbi:RidA family protein [Chitinophaga sp. SYP-B3965]|uniref:RidA family protein n=1 Tax=Chitinophaga sp. SYP-B3965 TaxID=2663120 RepID=UPI0012995196|nr:RidA family protein [Chitinophaga sp. SYP-B3965]MRG48916.1 RidA family protein [Chitinophaga sp. SYP-B3965]